MEDECYLSYHFEKRATEGLKMLFHLLKIIGCQSQVMAHYLLKLISHINNFVCLTQALFYIWMGFVHRVIIWFAMSIRVAKKVTV